MNITFALLLTIFIDELGLKDLISTLYSYRHPDEYETFLACYRGIDPVRDRVDSLIKKLEDKNNA